MTGREELDRAKDFTGPVRVHLKASEGGAVDGFIIGRGPEFFVMAVLDPADQLDGYSCLRYGSVSKCEFPHPSTTRIRKALRRHGEKPEYPRELAAPGLGQIIKFGGSRFGLIVVEDEEPDAALIGKVRFVTETFVQMILLTPEGDWDSEAMELDFAEIHRVDFGGAFELNLLRHSQGR